MWSDHIEVHHKLFPWLASYKVGVSGESWSRARRGCPGVPGKQTLQVTSRHAVCSQPSCRGSAGPARRQTWVPTPRNPSPHCAVGHARTYSRERLREKSVGIQTLSCSSLSILIQPCNLHPFWIHLACSLSIFFTVIFPVLLPVSPEGVAFSLISVKANLSFSGTPLFRTNNGVALSLRSTEK